MAISIHWGRQIGFATLLIGMIWIAPLLGHATWHVPGPD